MQTEVLRFEWDFKSYIEIIIFMELTRIAKSGK